MEEERERERNDEHGGREEEKKKRGRGMWIIRRRRTSGSDGRKVIESSVYYLGRWNERECMRTSMWYGGSGGNGFLRLLSGEEAHDDRWDPCVCATHAVSTSLFPLPSSLSLSLSYTRRSLVRRYSTRIAGEPCGRYVARARSAHARARRACLVLYVTCYGRPVPLAKA